LTGWSGRITAVTKQIEKRAAMKVRLFFFIPFKLDHDLIHQILQVLIRQMVVIFRVLKKVNIRHNNTILVGWMILVAIVEKLTTIMAVVVICICSRRLDETQREQRYESGKDVGKQASLAIGTAEPVKEKLSMLRVHLCVDLVACQFENRTFVERSQR
jgi:hypothetical protein